MLVWLRYYMFSLYLYDTYWQYRECCIWLDTDLEIIVERGVLEQVVSVRYILRIQRVLYLAWYRPRNYCRTWSYRASCICTIHTENTESVVSGLIQTEVLLVGHWVRERVVSERYIPNNTEIAVSRLTRTKEYEIEGRYNWRSPPYHMIIHALQTGTPFV